MNDDATVMTTKSAASAKGLPKCVCSWKNCRTYQKAYKSYGHSILDGIVKVKFIKGDTASIPLKASVDRTLKVPKEKRQDWKPAKGEEIIRYNIARHHFTEPHIQRYLQDPKRYKWTSLFSEAEAKKYLFKLDPKETMSLGDAEVYYVQCPNVSKDYVKQQFLKMKAEMEEKEAQEHALRQQQQQSSALGRFLGSGGAGTTTVASNDDDNNSKHLPEHKDSMTISTTRSSELLARKEEENKRLRKELEACKSQLTYLHEMVRQLQEDTCDNMSVYSRKSTRSRANKGGGKSGGAGGRGGGGGYGGANGGAFPHEIELLDDEESEWDGGGGEEEEIGDWSEDEDETIVDDESSNLFGKPLGGSGGPPRTKMNRRSSLASRASIVSASQSVKSLPREIELAEDEENGSGSEDSSMADAFDDRSYVSRGSRSRASHSIDNQNDYGGSGGGRDRRSGGSRKSKKKKSKGGQGFGGSSNGSDVETYEVKQQVIVDPYGEKGTYAGSLSKATGMPHGKGRLEYAAGRWYEGDWKHGRWTGRGRLSNGDGDLYEGELRNDHKHGKGTMRFADGRVFVGEYINGQMIEGKMTYQDGSTYEGSWVDGMRHGRGKCVFTDDSIYEGEFREGEFHGHGKMSWSDGGWYEGEWWNGEMQGHGKEVRPDGSLRHEGAWSKGQPLRNRK